MNVDPLNLCHMKKIINYILAFSTACGILTACDDFMEIHQKWIEGGEIVYATKIDSVAVYGGKERVKLGLWTYNATSVEQLVITWNFGTDSLVMPVSFNAGKDSMEVVIDNLPEKAYTFNVNTIDMYGNTSLVEVGTGSSYGADFEGGMNPRKVRSIVMGEDGGEITWATADEKVIATQVKFTDADDNAVELTVLPEERITICENIKSGTGFICRSLLLPEPAAIDTFYTEWSEPVVFPANLDRTGWQIVSCTSEMAGYEASNMLDDDVNSIWHTNYQTGDPFPHVIVIDMLRQVQVNSISLTRRIGFPALQGTFRYEISSDNEEYETLGEAVFGDPDVLEFVLATPESGRYIRLTALDNKTGTTDTSVSLATFEVIGTYLSK